LFSEAETFKFFLKFIEDEILSGKYIPMLIDLFNETWKELTCGTTVKGHPFRTCSLATNDPDSGMRQRLVILREVTEHQTLIFYTDIRSGKMNHLQKNPDSSVLFYNAQIKLQIMVQGKMILHTHDEVWQNHKLRIEGKSINDYNTKYPPGKAIKNPVDVTRTRDLNFAVLELQPEVIEYLKLKAELNRLRAVFRKKNEDWDKTFLVP